MKFISRLSHSNPPIWSLSSFFSLTYDLGTNSFTYTSIYIVNREEEEFPLTMAGAASALFLLDIKGRVLVWRDYRGDVSSTQAERFFTKLIEKEVFQSFFLISCF